MADYALRLVQHVKWQGVTMVEVKMDRHLKAPVLMEINERFWGLPQLAIDVGLIFSYLLYKAMNGEALSVPDNFYRVGTQSRWLLGDFDHLLMRMTKSNSALHLNQDASSRWRCLEEFHKLLQHDLHCKVESPSDPCSMLAEHQGWFSYLEGRRL